MRASLSRNSFLLSDWGAAGLEGRAGSGRLFSWLTSPPRDAAVAAGFLALFGRVC
jgi:hypothetical protein